MLLEEDTVALTDANGNVLTRAQVNALTTPVVDSDVTLTADVYETLEYAGAEDAVPTEDAHGVTNTRQTSRALKWGAGTRLKQSQLDAVYAVPTVTSVAPATGLAAGGTAVTVTGSGFARGQAAIGTISAKGHVTDVKFGGTNATSVVVQSDTMLTCVTPPHAAGAVAVAVDSAAGTGSAAGAFTYT